MKPVVLVPFRGDGGRRDLLWGFTEKWLREHLGSWDYSLFLGESPDGLFNRAAAVNDAARRAGDWDVALIMDADTLVPSSQLKTAVQVAADSGRLIGASTYVLELGKDCTDQLLNGNFSPETLAVDVMRTAENITQSSAVAVTRELFDAVRGFDERFIGWGGEDNAFWDACRAAAGKPERVPGPAIHLWHEESPNKHGRDNPHRATALRLMRQYSRARNLLDVQQIRGR